MIVGNQSMSLVESVLTAQATQSEIGVRVLKKAQDTAKQEGAAMVQLIDQSAPPTPPPSNSRLLDTYA